MTLFRPLLAAFAALAAAGCSRSAAEAGAATERAPRALVAWESNRSGAFRIWLADLEVDGTTIRSGEPRRLSPEEPERDHCCPVLSPDGARLVYAALRPQRGKYLPPETPVELRLVELDGGRERTLSRSARLNGENRAALWWSATDLVYLESNGTTRRLDLAAGTAQTIVPSSEGGGWLVAPGGRYASGADPTFSERDSEDGAIRLATNFGGCQPTFTADGELGLWTAGAGGPIDVIDLATRATRSILLRNDPRLPAGRRYLYFPAVAADRSLLAWAASDGGHDHFRADYDLFVAAVDPETLELAGEPVAIAPDPGVDRYPDLWRLAAPRAARRSPQAARPPPASAALGDAPLLVWRGAGDENRATPDSDSETVEGRGATWFDRLGRLALGGGFGAFRPASAERVDRRLRDANKLSVALLVEPASLDSGAVQPLVALGKSARQRGFALRQRGARIELLLRTSSSGPAGSTVEVATLPDRAPHQVAFRFSPGRFTSFLDGVPVRREELPGDFFHWRNDALRLGADPSGDDRRDPRFRGWLSELAIWDRELSDAEIAAEAARALGSVLAAPPVARHRVNARLMARSRAPTLEEISPYRSALQVEEYELVDRLDGAPAAAVVAPRFRVARWALLDGAAAPQAAVKIGAVVELQLEPFDAQPQLESVVLADTLPPAPGTPLFADVGTGAAPD